MSGGLCVARWVCWTEEQDDGASPGVLVRGSGFSDPRERSGQLLSLLQASKVIPGLIPGPSFYGGEGIQGSRLGIRHGSNWSGGKVMGA